MGGRKAPLPIVQEDLWALQLVWLGVENLASTEIFLFMLSFLWFALFFYPLCTFISSLLMCHAFLQNPTQISTPPAGFEPVMPAVERPQTSFDRTSTGTVQLVASVCSDYAVLAHVSQLYQHDTRVDCCMAC
jgi:hypothetical protein